MKQMSKLEVMKLNKHIKLTIIYTRGSSRHIRVKYRGSFNDPTIRKVLDEGNSKLNYKSRKCILSRYTSVEYDIPSSAVSDYIPSLNKISGLQCAQVEHITSVL